MSDTTNLSMADHLEAVHNAGFVEASRIHGAEIEQLKARPEVAEKERDELRTLLAGAQEMNRKLAPRALLPTVQARLEAAEKDADLWRWWCSQIKGVRTAEGSPYFSFPRLTPDGNIMRGSVYQHFEGAVRAAMAKEPKP